MNKVVLMGRPTKDPEVRYAPGENSIAVARFNLAVNRMFKRDGEQGVDFINCVAFGKNAEFIGKYFRKGMRVVVSGRIQTGSYTNRDGQKIYTTDVVIEEKEFAESKKEDTGSENNSLGQTPSGDRFMPDSDFTELPFN